MSKELKEALEEYAEKIHRSWINARDSELTAPTDLAKDYWRGIKESFNTVELELTKLLKEDEDRIKANVSRLGK